MARKISRSQMAVGHAIIALSILFPSCADSTILLAKVPQPPNLDVPLSGGEVLEIAGWPGISSKSSTTSKQDKIIHPAMVKAAKILFTTARHHIFIDQSVKCYRHRGAKSRSSGVNGSKKERVIVPSGWPSEVLNRGFRQ